MSVTFIEMVGGPDDGKVWQVPDDHSRSVLVLVEPVFPGARDLMQQPGDRAMTVSTRKVRIPLVVYDEGSVTRLIALWNDRDRG